MKALARALVLPVVVFGLLFAFVVQPERAAGRVAQQRLGEATARLDRTRASARSAPVVQEADAPGRAAEALAGFLSDPAVGPMENLSVETGVTSQDPSVPTLVSASFDARYEQIERAFRNLHTLPATLELRSVELTQGQGLLTHASVAFALYRTPRAQRPTRALNPHLGDTTAAPQRRRNPFILEAGRVPKVATRRRVAQR